MTSTRLRNLVVLSGLNGVLIGVLVACGASSGEVTTTPGTVTFGDITYARFETAVAAVDDRDFDVYWLGRRLRRGALELVGPQFVPLPDSNTQDFLATSYIVHRDEERRPSFNIRLSHYSKSLWTTSGDSRLGDGPDFQLEETTVDGRRVLLVLRKHEGIPDQLTAAVMFDRTVVVLSTNSAHPLSDPMNLNPFVSRDAMIELVEQLAPYEP